MRWNQFLAQIKKKKLKPAYLFVGRETLLMGEALAGVKARLISPASSVWNYQQFYCDESKAEDILIAANTGPAFSSQRLVVARNCERLIPAGLRLFISYLSNPCPTTCLLCTMETKGKGGELEKQFVATFDKADSRVDFSRVYDNELSGLIKKMAAGQGRKIENEAVTSMVEVCGGQLGLIKGELDKLDSFLPLNAPITRQDWEEIAGPARTDNIFALCDAIGRKEPKLAWELANVLITSGEPALKILPLITAHLRRIIRAKELIAAGQDRAALGKSLNIPDRFLTGFLNQADRFSLDQLHRHLNQALACDLAIKTSGLPPRLYLERFILRTCA